MFDDRIIMIRKVKIKKYMEAQLKMFSKFLINVKLRKKCYDVWRLKFCISLSHFRIFSFRSRFLQEDQSLIHMVRSPWSFYENSVFRISANVKKKVRLNSCSIVLGSMTIREVISKPWCRAVTFRIGVSLKFELFSFSKFWVGIVPMLAPEEPPLINFLLKVYII